MKLIFEQGFEQTLKFKQHEARIKTGVRCQTNNLICVP